MDSTPTSLLTHSSSSDLSAKQQKILGFLSTCFSRLDLGELYDIFQSRSKRDILNLADDCCRTSVFLSESQTSSLNSTISSIFSRDSYISTDSCVSPSPVAPCAIQQIVPAKTDIYGHSFAGAAQSFHDTYHSSPANQASPYPHVERRVLARHCCIACQKCYTELGKLNRHRKEKCESMGSYVCVHCSWQDQTFERPGRLRDHYLKEHGIVRDLEKGEFQKHPPKRAWGCPCCNACFANVEEWQAHETIHQSNIPWDGKTVDVRVDNWSWVTLITSLLFGSKNLALAARHYDWSQCKWSLQEGLWRGLKFALERHVLPHSIRRLPEYVSHNDAEALVFYVYSIGTSGDAYSQHLLAANSSYHAPSSPELSLDVVKHASSSFASRILTEQPKSAHSTHLQGPVSLVQQPPQIERSVRRQYSVDVPHDAGYRLDQLWLQSSHAPDTAYDPTRNVTQLIVSQPQHNAPQIAQAEQFQQGKSRQLSQSSMTNDTKRPKLRSSRSRSLRDCFRRPGSSKGKGSAGTAPPLPSPRTQQAVLVPFSEDVAFRMPNSEPQRRPEINGTRSNTPTGDCSHGDTRYDNSNASPKQLPVRSCQGPTSETSERNKEDFHMPNEWDSWLND